MNPNTAMVLAAGLGKRMRPLTATRPKPLVEVAGAPLIEHVFARLRAAGVPRAVVNVHYMADPLEAYLRHRVRGVEVIVSDERAQLLETGGGVLKALPLIDCDPFYVINSDNLWIDGVTPALTQLAARFDATHMDALLLVVPLARATGYSGPGDFRMDPWGRLSRRMPGRVAPYVFSGVQLLSKSLFEGLALEPFSLNRVYDRAAAQGRLFGLSHSGLWFHVGTPQAIPETEAVVAQR